MKCKSQFANFFNSMRHPGLKLMLSHFGLKESAQCTVDITAVSLLAAQMDIFAQRPGVEYLRRHSLDNAWIGDAVPREARSDFEVRS